MMPKKLLDIEVIEKVLPNGLRIILIPDEAKEKYVIEYLVNYGSFNLEFIVNNKKVKIPEGTAHFLEHKIFDSEFGDPFQFFSKSGSFANAYTSYERTVYSLEGNANLEENLDFLINYVNSPNFTDENVEKEKGIIIEEINMYDKHPLEKTFNERDKLIYHSHPMKDNIGGTVKSVKSISKEDLYNAFDAYYQPSNMAIVIGGKFDIEKVMKVITNNKVLSKQKKREVKEITPREKLRVVEEYKTKKIKGLAEKRFFLSFKFKGNFLNNYKERLVFDLLLTILFGDSSDFYNQMIEEGIIKDFGSFEFFASDFVVITMSATSDKPEILREKIFDTLKTKEITDNDLKRIVKNYIANYIRSFDYIDRIVDFVVSDINLFKEIIYNKEEIFRSITVDDLEKAKALIDLDNTSTFIAE